MTTKLSDTQRVLLERAITDNGGRISDLLLADLFPKIRGGAARNLITALGSRGLVDYDELGCYVTEAGHHAVGAEWLPCTLVHGPNGACPECAIDPDAEVDSGPSEPPTDSAPAPLRRPRENSKQAEVIRMLQRPEGATIAQIAAETGWQQHSVRGFFAGALKKRGIQLTSTKTSGGRIYRIAA
jgi:hypothetical protein